MAQSLVVLNYHTPANVKVATVIFAGTTADSDAVKNALEESLNRAIPGFFPLEPAEGGTVDSISRDETDDDTIGPGDEVSPVGNIVAKSDAQLASGA